MNTLFPLDELPQERSSDQRFDKSNYRGLLLIGDPHLEGRIPGFRKDDYPQTILEKLRWCLATAAKEKLLPLILGDLFQLPRDNPNWLVTELIQLFSQKVYGIYGNHDVHENQLDPNDTFSILESAGCIELLSVENTLALKISGHKVLIGGTSWGQALPVANHLELDGDPLVIWLTHHDLAVPGYEAGKVQLNEDMPFDLMINGHIHRRLDDFRIGKTTVITPGNISRRKRSDATRSHIPSVLQVELDSKVSHTDSRLADSKAHWWTHSYLQVPHRPFEEVFHAAVEISGTTEARSDFVSGLAELQSRRTQTGAGLSEFLAVNLEQFEAEIADEIRLLADEVLERN